MILVIDNYDSFTYNLVQYLGELGQTISVAKDIQVFRNESDHPGRNSGQKKTRRHCHFTRPWHPR